MSFIYNMADTWNAIGTTFYSILMNTSNGAAGAPVGAAASRAISLQSNGTPFFEVDISGNVLSNGQFSGVTGLNTNEYNVCYNSIGGTFTIASVPTNSITDIRYTYSGTAPNTATLTGPSFYTTVSPSTNVDEHIGSYNGISATVFSNSTTTLQQMIGGNFAAIRTATGGGSTNPVYGVVGTSVAGDQGIGGVVSGDGFVGGMFTAYSNLQAASNVYDPMIIKGQIGVLGRVVINNNYLANLDNVGVAGYVDIESTSGNIYAGRFGTGSVSHTTALTTNNFGVYVDNIANGLNMNCAILTNNGTVQLGGNIVTNGSHVGNQTLGIPIGTPTISNVFSGATGKNSHSGGGTKTYTYKIVAVFAAGETSAASGAVSTTTGFDDLSQTGENNLILWSAVEGAVGGYNIYRTAAGGATTNTTGLIANVPQNITPIYNGNAIAATIPSYVDVGAAGDSSSPPSTNTTGSVFVGNAALTTTATTGFLNIPTCAGTPTGTPSLVTGVAPMVYDTSAHKFWMYDVGAAAWRGVALT